MLTAAPTYIIFLPGTSAPPIYPCLTELFCIMSVSAQLAEIERYLIIAKAEDAKLAKGTKSAAAKLRGALLEIGKECSESRKLALGHGKAIPVKKRAPKESKESEEELPEAIPQLQRQDASADVKVASRKPRWRKPKAVPVPAAAVIAA